MKITVHIGATKTGSSALQAHLYQGRGQLRRTKILYPDIGIAANAHHLLFAAVHPNAWAMHRAAFSEKEAERLQAFRAMMNEILTEAADTDTHHVVLSSEYLWGVLHDRFSTVLSNTLRGHDIRLVAVLRRQDLWLEASYLQAVKFGLRKPFEAWLPEFIRTPHSGHDYAAVISGWEQALSPIETCIVPYEFVDRTEFTREVVNLVCDADIARDVVPSTAHVANPSPSRAGLSALLGETGLLGDMWRSAGTRDAMLFSRADQRAVLEGNRSTNEHLARRFNPNGPPQFFDMSDLAAVNSSQ